MIAGDFCLQPVGFTDATAWLWKQKRSAAGRSADPLWAALGRFSSAPIADLPLQHEIAGVGGPLSLTNGNPVERAPIRSRTFDLGAIAPLAILFNLIIECPASDAYGGLINAALPLLGFYFVGDIVGVGAAALSASFRGGKPRPPGGSSWPFASGTGAPNGAPTSLFG